MKLNVVGCSPAWHDPGGVQSGYLLEEDGRRLLLDCGPGVLASLRRREGWPHVDAIAITHFHLDHWGDLLPWSFGAAFGPGRGSTPPELWLPPDGAARLRSLDSMLSTFAMFEAFAVREYAEGVPFEAAGFHLTALRTLHYEQTSFGFRVNGGASTLAYSGDSAPAPVLAELARDADLFVCEATLADPEPGLRGHLTVDEALDAFRAAGAARLLVVHRPAELSVPDGVERARDGLRLEV